MTACSVLQATEEAHRSLRKRYSAMSTSSSAGSASSREVDMACAHGSGCGCKACVGQVVGDVHELCVARQST